MADYTNPAGRLHELLTRFGRNPNQSILAAWAEALEVRPPEVPYHLGRVAGLLQEVRRAAEETGSSAFEPMTRHLSTLAESIFPTNAAFNGEVARVVPDENAMEMLGTLSFALSLSASEGSIPADDELDGLKQSVRELIDEVKACELPPEIRRALLHRLAEMLEALEHLEIGGPDAVRRAAESLAVTAAIYAREADEPATIHKITQFARKAWTVFTAATTVAGYALTWDRIVDLTGLGEGAAQPQLPPGPPPPAGEQSQPPDEPNR